MGKDTDGTKIGQASRDDTIREFGTRIKNKAKELGFATHADLYDKVQEKRIGIDLEVFSKLLNGRRDSRWYDVFSAMAEIFAERHIQLWGNPEKAQELTTSYRRVIFGPGPDIPFVDLEVPGELTPSFEQLHLPVQPTDTADRFLDAMPPTLADIAADFDIHRTVFTAKDGLRDSVLGWLTHGSGPLLVSMSGASGAGKTVASLRLAYECLLGGFQVLKLLPDWMCSDGLGVQVRRVLTSNKQPSLFIFDDAGSLARKDVQPADIFRTVSDVTSGSVLLFIENFRLFAPFAISGGGIGANQAKHFSVGYLTTTELTALLDRMIQLETTNRVKDVRCQLSRESRLALCSENRDRLAAAALLIFRYGRHVVDILVDEFNAIDEDALRYAYLCAVVFGGLGLSIPRSIIAKARRDKGNPSGRFWTRLAEITAQQDEAISLRHPLFFRHLAPVVISNPDDRADIVADVLSHADPDDLRESNFALGVFGHPKRITELLLSDTDAISRWISAIKSSLLARMPTALRRSACVCLGHLSRHSLDDYDKAHEFYEAAISCDPRFGFAYRQRSWNLLKAGRLPEAEKSANNAVVMLPEDAKTLSDSAMVLQYCSLAGFRRAAEVHAKALTISGYDSEFRTDLAKRMERYQEASYILSFYSLGDTNDLPDQVLQSLKAPWFIWKVRKGFKRAIKGKLGSFLRDYEVDADELAGVVRSVGQHRDNVVKALIQGNTARVEYQQWYHAGKQIDFRSVGNLFFEALTGLKKEQGKNESEAFIRTWYGTFLKEAMRNYVDAESEYRRAIKNASNITDREGNHPFRNEPMLLNNLALLLMHAARIGIKKADALEEAEQLLINATAEVTKRESRFLWPFETLQELKLLKAEILPRPA